MSNKATKGNEELRIVKVSDFVSFRAWYLYSTHVMIFPLWFLERQVQRECTLVLDKTYKHIYFTSFRSNTQKIQFKRMSRDHLVGDWMIPRQPDTVSQHRWWRMGTLNTPSPELKYSWNCSWKIFEDSCLRSGIYLGWLRLRMVQRRLLPECRCWRPSCFLQPRSCKQCCWSAFRSDLQYYYYYSQCCK